MKIINLDRLVINLSHNCNLKCRYCYAASGSYRGPRGFLSLEMGKRILDYFYTVCHQINFIQFFGGEPLLNYKIIDPLCRYIIEESEKRNIKPPVLGMVTNGTILNKTILKTIQKYSIRVTVSLDGLSDINDSLRIFRNGVGSFKRITTNIKMMKQETGQPVRIEGTLTAEHLRRGFSLEVFMNYILDEMRIHSIHMPWIFGDCYSAFGISPSVMNTAQVLQLYFKAIDRALQSLVTPDVNEMILISYVERYLERYFNHTHYGPYLCSAGNGSIGVSIDGSIYPCFMFINNEKFKLGRIDITEPQVLIKKMHQFSQLLRIPADSFVPVMFCPGNNYTCHGSLNRIRTEEEILYKELDNYIKKELEDILSTQSTENWIKTKLVLYNLLTDMK